MKAIVCDKCGKVVLLPDRVNTCADVGFHQLYSDTLACSKLDLCEECAEELMKAVHEK